VGTGRIIFSLNYSDADFEEVTSRFIAAGQAMKADGWWWHDGLATNQSIKRRILGELLRAKLS
jgi:glutamate-1-semialdehyde 2,1-aminomutase